jgi:hypothetical protein
MEAASTSETSINVYQTTRHKNPVSHLYIRRRENLKSQIIASISPNKPQFLSYVSRILKGEEFSITRKILS